MASLIKMEWTRLRKNKKNLIVLGIFLAFVLLLPSYHKKIDEKTVLQRDSIYEASLSYAETEGRMDRRG